MFFLPTCAQGSSAAVAEFVGKSAFWGFRVLPGVLDMGGTGSAGLPLHVYRTGATQVCQSQDTPKGNYLRSLLGVHWFPPTRAWKIGTSIFYYVDVMLYVLTLVRLPSPWLLCMNGKLG